MYSTDNAQLLRTPDDISEVAKARDVKFDYEELF